MQFSIDIYKEIDFLSRLLTSNPYTAEGKSILNGLKVDLTTKEFFEKEIYAKPFFLDEQGDNRNKENHIEDMDEEDAFDREDYIFVSDAHSLSINSMIKEYGNFCQSFNNLNEFPILFIRGGSGTGKSTYMYSLIYGLLKNNPNIQHTELTLEKYTERPYYYGISLPIMSDNTLSKFIRIVYTKIFSIIDNEIRNKDIDKLNNIFACYQEKFMSCSSENPINIAVFKAFCGTKFQKLDTVKHNQRVIEEGIKLLSGTSNKMILCNLLLLLIELCYCLNPSKFHLLSFDGIEYLINRTHHIYDSDINDILSAFYKVKRSAEDLFSECQLNFANNFKIVMAIRNATLNYCYRREQEDIRDSNISVDVTDWYRMEDIYEKRIKYFSENEYINEQDLVKIKDIVEIVIRDTRRGKKRASGAMDMLERMYNFDKRSLQSNLLIAISQIVLSSEGGILKNKFIEFYNEKGPMLYDNNKQGYRFRYLCRRAIIRILLNRIEAENQGTFLDGIYFSELGDESMPSSYMRKMLIFLMHNQVSNNRIKDEYVSFDSVINSIARIQGNAVITDATLEQIARLIYRLSDFRLHDSAWQQLISIKFNLPDNKSLSSEEQFIWKIKKMYKKGLLKNESFGVKINYAGAFLAYIQSDFEFFACRCKKFKVPLIFSNDVKYITSLLEEVHLKAVNCMKMVIEDEKNIFGDYKEMHLPDMKYLYKDDVYVPNGRLLPHPKRIINNHIMYLEHYRYFVNEVRDILNDEEKKVIVDKINEMINKYKRNYNDLVKGFGSVNGDFYGTMYLKDYYETPYLWKSAEI
ncbi:MAG: hypothetical protein NC489_26350 [Ruminococcus flavefaciens]|nr:hypothetical protein [Ruminococcus flavefaciens]